MTTISTATVDQAVDLFTVDELALPAHQPDADVTLRIRGATILLSAIAGVVLLMAVGAQTALYFAARPFGDPWVIAKAETYDGFALITLLVFASFFAQWVVWAVKHEARRQAIGASTGLVLSTLAFINLGWYHLNGLEFRATESTYTLVVWTVQLTIGVAVIACSIGAIVVLIKAMFGVQGRHDAEDSRSVALFTHLTLAAGLIVYWLVWFVK
jgi:hypothetical protein